MNIKYVLVTVVFRLSGVIERSPVSAMFHCGILTAGVKFLICWNDDASHLGTRLKYGYCLVRIASENSS